MSEKAQYGFTYVADFAAVARAGQQIANVRIDADADFVPLALHLSAWFTDGIQFVSRSNIVGTDSSASSANFAPVTLATKPKLYRDGNQNIAAVSGAGLHHLKLAFATADRQWQSAPMRADLITSEPGRIFLLPVPPIIPAQSVVQVTLYNDLPSTIGGQGTHTIDGQLLLIGYKQQR
jgi:hypothetical protein